MPALLSKIGKPEYLFRPSQALKRLQLAVGRRPAVAAESVAVPWGHVLTVDPEDVLGRALTHLGVYDLPVSEVMWRLFPRGGLAVDVGANIGYTASLLAAKGGPGSRVIAFEPHPGNFKRLRHNVTTWGGAPSKVELHESAVGEAPGTAELVVPEGFATNAGLAHLADSTLRGAEGKAASFEVKVERLQDVIGDAPVDLLKVDVEGAELSVFRGASDLLKGKQVRDIVFEDHNEHDSPVRRLLAEHGYSIFRIERSLLRPVLKSAAETGRPNGWEPPNFLATKEPGRALGLVGALGWQVLHPELAS